MNEEQFNLTENEKMIKDIIVDIVEKYLYADSGKSEIDVSREIYKQVRDIYDL